MSTIWKNGKYQPLVKYVTLKDLKKLSNAIDIINGDSDTKGSIKKAIKDLVGEAPEAYDTLKEIADKLKSDDDLHKALNDAIILKASSDALNTEINRATSAETANKNAIDGEVTRAKSAEKSLQDQITQLGILTYDCSKGGTITHTTLQDAINSVPTTFQKVGLTITYKSEDTIHRYTLKANSWSADPANWFSLEDKLSDLERIKMDRTSIAQELGQAEDKVMSQKVISTELNKKVDKAAVDAELAKKANKADMNVELNKKFDKASIVQITGASEDKVMSQKATSTQLNNLATKNREQDAELSKKFDKKNIAQEIGNSTTKVVSQNVIFDNIRFPVMKFYKGMMEITNEIGEDGNATGNVQINVLQEIKYTISSKQFRDYDFNRYYTIAKKSYIFSLPSTQCILCWNYNNLQFEAYKLKQVHTSYCIPICYIYIFEDKKIHVNINLINNIIGIRLKNYKTNTLTYFELNNLDSIHIRDIMPDDIENEDLMNYIKIVCRNVKTIYIDEGDYKTEGFFFSNTSSNIKYYSNKHIIGVNRDKCIIRGWDFKNNIPNYNLSSANFINTIYKNLTLYNCGFGYSLPDDFYNEPFYITIENIVFNVTLNSQSRYLNLIHSKHCKFTIKDCIINVNDDVTLYTAVWIDIAKKLIIDNCIFNGLLESDRSKQKITHPICITGTKNVIIKNNKVYGGTTGIITRVDKTASLEHFTIEHNTVEGTKEEGISFDCFGNNVGLHPTICELSITSAEYITYTLLDNTNKSLKLYCTARNLKGSHPNETWQVYSLIEHKDYLKDFYIYFSNYAGDVFGGTICKCLDVGEDDKGVYIIADISFDPATLELSEDTDPKVGTNDSKRTSNFKRASIVSGMFYMSIKNNIIRNTKGTGLALFCSIYNSVVDGNTFENCAGGCYMFSSVMLAVAAFTPCCNNKIINNSIIGGGTLLGETGYGFTFYGYAEHKDMLCYNNVFANNYLNTNQLYINNVKNLILTGNILDGNTILRLKNTVETNVFGTKLPVAPLPGQHFFNTTTKKEMMYNGTEWIEVI